MAYSTSNPPALLSQTIGGSKKVYVYASTDNAAAVRAAGYITNAKELGMKAGDKVISVDTDDATMLTTEHVVVSVNATTGAGDLSDGSAGSGANT